MCGKQEAHSAVAGIVPLWLGPKPHPWWSFPRARTRPRNFLAEFARPIVFAPGGNIREHFAIYFARVVFNVLRSAAMDGSALRSADSEALLFSASSVDIICVELGVFQLGIRFGVGDFVQ